MFMGIPPGLNPYTGNVSGSSSASHYVSLSTIPGYQSPNAPSDTPPPKPPSQALHPKSGGVNPDSQKVEYIDLSTVYPSSPVEATTNTQPQDQTQGLPQGLFSSNVGPSPTASRKSPSSKVGPDLSPLKSEEENPATKREANGTITISFESGQNDADVHHEITTNKNNIAGDLQRDIPATLPTINVRTLASVYN